MDAPNVQPSAPERTLIEARRSRTLQVLRHVEPAPAPGTQPLATPAPDASKWRLARDLIAAVILFLALDAAIFRGPLYPSFLEPDSYAGRAHHNLVTVPRVADAALQDAVVIVVGDSRIAEGFSSKTADAVAASMHTQFINAAMPGTNAKAWYYLLRETDPNADRFEAVVVPCMFYDDKAPLREIDAAIAHSGAPLIRYVDIIEFARTTSSWQAFSEALKIGSFKSYAYQQDFQAFLMDPASRIKKAVKWREHRHEALYSYGGNPQTMEGLSLDANGIQLHIDDRMMMPVHSRERLEEWFTRVMVHDRSPEVAEFNQHWLNKIVSHYAGSSTQIILMRMPVFPLPNLNPSTNADSVVRQLARDGKVTLLPEETFLDLEQPEFFFDGLHLNSAGQAEFSHRLARHVAETLQLSSSNPSE